MKFSALGPLEMSRWTEDQRKMNVSSSGSGWGFRVQGLGRFRWFNSGGPQTCVKPFLTVGIIIRVLPYDTSHDTVSQQSRAKKVPNCKNISGTPKFFGNSQIRWTGLPMSKRKPSGGVGPSSPGAPPKKKRWRLGGLYSVHGFIYGGFRK